MQCKSNHTYWIVFCYSKDVSFDVFSPKRLCNFFRNMFNTKTIEMKVSLLLKNKAIQCVHTSAYSSRFITHAPSSAFLGRLFLEKMPLNFGSSWQYFCISIFFKGWGGIKNRILFFKEVLQFIFLLTNFLRNSS